MTERQRVEQLINDVRQIDAEIAAAKAGLDEAYANANKVYANQAPQKEKNAARDRVLDAELTVNALEAQRAAVFSALAEALPAWLQERDAELAAAEAAARDQAVNMMIEAHALAGRLAALVESAKGPVHVVQTRTGYERRTPWVEVVGFAKEIKLGTGDVSAAEFQAYKTSFDAELSRPSPFAAHNAAESERRDLTSLRRAKPAALAEAVLMAGGVEDLRKIYFALADIKSKADAA